MAADDAHALSLARRIVANLNTKKNVDIPLLASREPNFRAGRARRHRAGRPAQAIRRPRDHRAAWSTPRNSTSSRRSTAPRWSPASRISGIPVGILANNGILFSESALKAAHFIELCCQRRIPLLFLQNISGFMVGRDYEAGGIAKDGAKMVTAVACAGAEDHRDRRRLVRRRQLRHVRPRLRPALPVHLAERAHLGDGRRAGGLGAGDGQARQHRGRGQDLDAADEDAFKAPIRAQYEEEGNPYYATARLWDDGIILPSETRRVLALAFSAALNAPIPADEVRGVSDVKAATRLAAELPSTDRRYHVCAPSTRIPSAIREKIPPTA